MSLRVVGSHLRRIRAYHSYAKQADSVVPVAGNADRSTYQIADYAARRAGVGPGNKRRHGAAWRDGRPARRPAPTRAQLAAPYERDDLRPDEVPVYPKRRVARHRVRALLTALDEEERLRMVAERRAVLPERLPAPKAGDIVRIAYRDPQKRQLNSVTCGGLLDALDADDGDASGKNKKQLNPAKVKGKAVDAQDEDSKGVGADGPIRHFAGIVIAFRKRGLGSTLIVRNVVDGVAVERGFPYYSPTVVDAWHLGRIRRRVRTHKIWYLRDLPLRQSTVAGAVEAHPEN